MQAAVERYLRQGPVGGKGDDDYDDDELMMMKSMLWISPIFHCSSRHPFWMPNIFLDFDFRVLVYNTSPADRCGKVIFRRPGPHFGLLDFGGVVVFHPQRQLSEDSDITATTRPMRRSCRFLNCNGHPGRGRGPRPP